MTRDELFEHLDANTQVLKNPAVRKAFLAVDRADFVAGDYEPEAYEDYALPLANGESITKPTIAAFMLELLDAKPGDNALEVGSGSGWTLALLADMAGPEGKATGVEIDPELVHSSKKNLAKYQYPHASIEQATPVPGFHSNAPYDRILCTSTVDEIPAPLVADLREGGTIVIPVKGMIIRGTKSHGKLKEETFPGTFMFDPLQ